jgi:NADH-quinone oxidoreductase subunit L
MVTALMTSFYMFRLLFLTFFGKTRGHFHPEHHGTHNATPNGASAHESPLVMTLPLAILALGSIFIGLPGSPWLHNWFQSFLHGSHEAIGMNTFVMAVSITVSALGLLIAFVFYLVKPAIPKRLAENFGILYSASKNKLWFDEIYQATVIRWFKGFANLAFKFDVNVIDRTVNEVGLKTVWTAKVKNWFDQYIVDGTVNGVGFVTRMASAMLRFVQTGFVSNYLFVIVLGIVVIIFATIK